jgi:acyl-CoA synthetase (AMP-forming)/AMP-acid ligase II
MLLHQAFDFQAGSRGDHCFALFQGRSISYHDAYDRSIRMTSAFDRLGLNAGDRICLLSRNSVDSVLLLLAASRRGVVPVPLNYRLAPPEWLALAADADARLLIAEPELAAQLDAFEDANPSPSEMIRVSTGEAFTGWASLDELIRDAPAAIPNNALSDEATAVQIYTSGTTGKAKGALLSHRAVIENLSQGAYGVPYRLNPGDRSLVALPLFHIAGIAAALNAASTGATLVVHRDIDPLAIVKSLNEDEISVAMLVPAVIQFILTSVPGIEKMTFPHLKFLVYGASPISAPVLREAMAIFQCSFVQSYGMTEVSGGITLLSERDHIRALESDPDLLLSAGRSLPGTQLRILKTDGSEARAGEVGEILVRGGQIMSGYWKMPEATADSFVDGWMRTGDAGYLDDSGYLFLRDRVKDMIVSGAENIYPVEIETVLIDHPDVQDVAVIGLPDTTWGEAVTAVIVLEPGSTPPTFEALNRFCRAKLGGFKVPKRYEFTETLPRNPSGKILKRALRGHYSLESGVNSAEQDDTADTRSNALIR